MDNITKCKIIGCVSLFGSLLMNPQLTIAIAISVIVFLTIGLGFISSADDFDIEENNQYCVQGDFEPMLSMINMLRKGDSNKPIQNIKYLLK